MERTQPEPTCKGMARPAPGARWVRAETLVVAEWLAAHDWQPLNTAACRHLNEQIGRKPTAIYAKGQALRTLCPGYEGKPMKTSPLDARTVDEVLARR